MQSRGDEEFACTFGRGFVEDGRFNLKKAMLIRVVAHDLDDLMPRHEGLGHVLAADVEVAGI